MYEVRGPKVFAIQSKHLTYFLKVNTHLLINVHDGHDDGVTGMDADPALDLTPTRRAHAHREVASPAGTC